MPTPVDRLTKLLAYHENAAAALRITIQLVEAPTGIGRPRKASAATSAMDAALELDAARRARNGTNGHHATGGRPPGTGTPHTGASVARLREQRRGTLKFLERFGPNKARNIEGNERRLVGLLLRTGYLKKRGTGYVRTSKPFSVEKYSKRVTGKPRQSARRPGGYTNRQIAQRRASAKLLEGFSTTEPRAAADVLGKKRAKFVGPWMHGGYVKRQGDGFVRTDKPFVIDPTAAE